MPTLDGFARLVISMRAAQVHYLRHRSPDALERVRRLQDRVDELAPRCLSGDVAVVTERSLF